MLAVLHYFSVGAGRHGASDASHCGNEVAKYALKPPVKQFSPPTCRNDSSWEFQVEKDGNDHGLSEEQCRAAFPKLFVELEKSASFRENNPIQFKDVDRLTVEDGMVRGIIDHGEVGSSQKSGLMEAVY